MILTLVLVLSCGKNDKKEPTGSQGISNAEDGLRIENGNHVPASEKTNSSAVDSDSVSRDADMGD